MSTGAIRAAIGWCSARSVGPASLHHAPRRFRPVTVRLRRRSPGWCGSSPPAVRSWSSATARVTLLGRDTHCTVRRVLFHPLRIEQRCRNVRRTALIGSSRVPSSSLGCRGSWRARGRSNPGTSPPSDTLQPWSLCNRSRTRRSSLPAPTGVRRRGFKEPYGTFGSSRVHCSADQPPPVTPR